MITNLQGLHAYWLTDAAFKALAPRDQPCFSYVVDEALQRVRVGGEMTADTLDAYWAACLGHQLTAVLVLGPGDPLPEVHAWTAEGLLVARVHEFSGTEDQETIRSGLLDPDAFLLEAWEAVLAGDADDQPMRIDWDASQEEMQFWLRVYGPAVELWLQTSRGQDWVSGLPTISLDPSCFVPLFDRSTKRHGWVVDSVPFTGARPSVGENGLVEWKAMGFCDDLDEIDAGRTLRQTWQAHLEHSDEVISESTRSKERADRQVQGRASARADNAAQDFEEIAFVVKTEDRRFELRLRSMPPLGAMRVTLVDKNPAGETSDRVTVRLANEARLVFVMEPDTRPIDAGAGVTVVLTAEVGRNPARGTRFWAADLSNESVVELFNDATAVSGPIRIAFG